jgi:gas vesicle protein
MNSVYKNNRARPSKSSKSHLTMSMGGLLLGGLGIGAVVMYFLDPNAGSVRRQGAVRLANQTGEHLGKVRDTVMRAVKADSISDAVEQITEALPALQEAESPSCSFLPMTTTAVGCCLLGAAVMFLLDPSSGRRRRGLIRDNATSRARRAADVVTSKARHLRNKAQGMYHDATEAVQNSRLAGLAGASDDSASQ